MRKCTIFFGENQEECLFHKFGTTIIHGSDNEPREKSIAIVEVISSKKVKEVDPNEVTFIDDPE